jgi:thiamine biosynthesis lipoprotein
VARDTDGAFDPTVNPLMRLWGFRGGETRTAPPGDDEIAAALERVGWSHVALVKTLVGGMSVFMGRSGMEIDLGGIAKGAAVDFAFDRLRAAGYRDFMVNLGGNIRVSGRPEPGRDEWRVAIRDPANPDATVGDPVILQDGEAVATSGSYERFVEIGGVRYSHIIDPRTGRPAGRAGSVSVVAPTAAEADAYSTASFVQGLGAADGGATLIRIGRNEHH